jgi:hypothetical protein
LYPDTVQFGTMTASERAGSGTGGRLPADVVRDLLADDGCRRVLACLAGREEPVPVDDLARAVAARDTGVDESDIDDATAATYRDALFQEHLPKLTPTGVVAYNSLLGTVALDTRDDRILTALE